jgi:hypothetical protein
VAALDARLAAFLTLSSEGAHAGDLIHCMSPAVKSAQAAFYEDERVLVAALLGRGAAAGELRVDDAELVARAVLRAYATFTLPWLVGKDPADLHRAHAAMHRLVLEGLLRRAVHDGGSAGSAGEGGEPATRKKGKTRARS